MESPKITALNEIDRISWWTKNGDGHIDFDLLNRIVESKANLDPNTIQVNKNLNLKSTILPPKEDLKNE